MQKPVKSIIASALALLRRPSEAKLATNDLKLFLHQTLEELHSLCIKENSDFFTHDFSIDLTYNTDTLGWEFTVDSNQTAVSTDDVIPVYLKYQPSTDDQNEDPWYRVNISKLDTFGQAKPFGVVEAALVGNSWQGLTAQQFKLNVNEEFVGDQRWRMACRVFPTDVLAMEDMFPFPGEFSSLVEHMLALRAIPVVRDDSPSWRSFAASQTQLLMVGVKNGTDRLLEWLNKDVENRILTLDPYHYRYNNKLINSRPRRFRVEW